MASVPVSEFINTVRSGDRLATLCALRDRLAVAMEESERGSDVAALALRITDVLKQIHEITGDAGANTQPDVVNEVLERAKKRQSG